MKYNNHPRPPIRCLSGETLVRIADRLAGMLNLTAVDPVVIQATVITEGGTTEIVGEGGNEQIAWIRADSICYLRLRDFRLCYAYATREAVERDRQFAEHFRDCCHISLPDVITDAAREVLLEIGDADYWVAPDFRNLLTSEERSDEKRPAHLAVRARSCGPPKVRTQPRKEERRYASRSHVESPAPGSV